MDVVKIAKAFSDPLRWQIFLRILNREAAFRETNKPGVCVCDLVEGMGLLQSKVSYHIKELKEAGLITEVAQGKWNYYSVNRDTLRTYLGTLGELFDR
ncbi:metalloregulator ArsR/SmtB family transcription factor [Heliobacterium gestii]|uniref:Metalloregulator ArsR/SmtB family transcription factor n=1 Tax=Heliomicrobium gestii TaxID=2699 RepID=A0A845L825_HELGE|nr:metalloregulator ArsR/SmtB family transcription factor [Heliomicrobium gestii]MBM7866327.1 ArsR family transcriptional regulator [Heliomicrobium gestii]MZP42887.1 metalloregulator ArsR/SmtB family transcription factor [Heliomicrobium gestii]